MRADASPSMNLLPNELPVYLNSTVSSIFRLSKQGIVLSITFLKVLPPRSNVYVNRMVPYGTLCC